jgi:hypothetical protein
MPLTKIQSLGITDGTIVNADINASAAIATSKLSGGTNTPAFSATMTSDQTFTDVVYAKVQYNSEVFDTDSAYDPTTNYRFTVPTGKSGKYFFNLQAYIVQDSSTVYAYDLEFRKNNTAVAQHNLANVNENGFNTVANCNVLLDLADGDYVEVFLIINTANGNSARIEADAGSRFNNFQGFKLI